MIGRHIVGVVALMLLAACSSKQAEVAAGPAAAPALQSEATSRQVMLGLTIPAADVIWGVGSKAPENDVEWERVTANAVMLAESGLLLMSAPRDVNQPEWTQHATDLVRHARAAAEAARNHDVDAVLAAGDEIYTNCDACHNKYMPAKAAELAEQAETQK
jgi:hypothetical protein